MKGKQIIKDYKMFWKFTIVFLIATALHKVEMTMVPTLNNDSFIQNLINEIFFFVVVVCCAVYTKKLSALRPAFKGLGTGLRCGWWFILYPLWILNITMTFHPEKLESTISGEQNLLFIIFVLMVGLTEELLFRGVLLGGYLDVCGEDTPGAIRTAIILSGCFFGLIHITNIFNGMSFSSALVQGVANMAAGILFGAVYIRSRKNLLPCILLHAFNDYCGMIAQGVLNGVDVVNTDASYSPVVLIFSAIQLLIALILLRNKKIPASPEVNKT